MLTRLEGVSQTKLRIGRETRLEVTTRDGAWVPPQRMLQQIARGNFHARRDDMRMSVSGTVLKAESGLRLAVPGPVSEQAVPVVLRLSEFAATRPGKSGMLDAIAERVGERIELTGLWRDSNEAAGRILVQEWRSASR